MEGNSINETDFMPKKQKTDNTSKTKSTNNSPDKEQKQEDRYTASERAADFKEYAELKKR